MMLDFACPGCGQKYRVDVGLSGRKIKCKKCETPVTVPSPNAVAPTPTRPPIQSFGEAPTPKPKPAVQSFGEAPRATPAPSRRPAPPVEEDYDYGEDDVAGPPEDLYGMDDVYAAPKARVDDDDDGELGPIRRVKPKGKKKARLDPASTGRRLLAIIIDVVVTSAISFAVGFVLGIILFSNGIDVTSPSVQLQMNLLGFVLAFLYYSISESSSSQATLGKKAMGLTVVDLQGQRVPYWRAAVRYLLKIVFGLTVIPGLVSVLMVVFSEKKRALHDLVAGTMVVE